MSGSMVQYQATKLGGPFALTKVPRPHPEPTEVSIRIKAVALNPLDWMMLSRGEMVHSWPAVLGIDVAGVVDRVGSQVTQFQPGDDVFSLSGHGGRAGGFQEFATVPQHFVAKLPSMLSYNDGASLPIAYLTAASAILFGLHVPISHISPKAPGDQSRPPGSVLVLGGAGGVGSSAIQLLRSALPDTPILTTASPKHATRLMDLGASLVIDRHSPSLVLEVRKALAGGVDAILDCVTAAAADETLFQTFRNDGPRIYSQVFTGEAVVVPDGVQSTAVFGRQVFGAPGGVSAMASLSQAIEEGRYRLPVPIKSVGTGWDAVGLNLKQFSQGVSGEKLVVAV